MMVWLLWAGTHRGTQCGVRFAEGWCTTTHPPQHVLTTMASLVWGGGGYLDRVHPEDEGSSSDTKAKWVLRVWGKMGSEGIWSCKGQFV